jgi:hypothetical protein
MTLTSRIAGLVAAAGIAVTAMAAPAGAATAAASRAATATKKDCDDTRWPASVQGRPTTLQDGAAEGVYLWHDHDGWHLRVTHAGHDKVVFTGRIQSATKMDAVPRRDEKADVVVERGEKSVSFRFTNYGYIDGLDFRTACAPQITFGFKADGKKLPPSMIFGGSANAHPKADPFTVRRTK